jgi:hypothetical protein
MGFRTLALEQRSAEVWEVLGAVKTEFGKFGDVLAKTKKKLDEASNTIDAAEVRTRAMARQLKSVEALPEAQAADSCCPGPANRRGHRRRKAPMAEARRGPAPRIARRQAGPCAGGADRGPAWVHSAMAGLRLAAPLQALREGYSAWTVGLLLALFAAAPVLTAMHAGRLADRLGYHRPVYAGGGAVGDRWPAGGGCPPLCRAAGTSACCVLAATLVGAGTNVGMLTVQRTAGLAARDTPSACASSAGWVWRRRFPTWWGRWRPAS